MKNVVIIGMQTENSNLNIASICYVLKLFFKISKKINLYDFTKRKNEKYLKIKYILQREGHSVWKKMLYSIDTRTWITIFVNSITEKKNPLNIHLMIGKDYPQ